MTLKVIATDMDGTFLKGDRSYDKDALLSYWNA